VQSDKRRIAFIVGATVVLGFIFLAPGYIRPDSVGVYSWVRSAVFDRDLLFFNEWHGFGMIRNQATAFKEVTPVGTVANHWWIGTSLLAAPAYLIAAAAATLLKLPGEGFLGLYAAVLAWTTVALTAVSLLLMTRISGARGLDTAIVPLAVLFGTPLFWYTFRFPLGTHAAGAFGVTIALYFLLDTDRLEFNSYTIGLAVGLAGAIRLQHLALIAAVLTMALMRHVSSRFYLRCAMGISVAMLPQIIAWWIVYGSPAGPLTSGGSLGGVTYTVFHATRFIPVLLSSYHGLFSWAPVTLLSIIGLVLALRMPDRARPLVLLVAFAAELTANATMDRYFWGGFSFGPRRFVDLAPVFAVGIAWFLQLAKPRVIAISSVLAATVWSTALAFAAISDRLELARYVSTTEVVKGFLDGMFPRWSTAMLRSPIFDPRLLVHSMAALLILGTLAAIVWRFRRFAQKFATVYLALCAFALVLLWNPTRSRAESEMTRFGIDPAIASKWGPLSDQSRLLQDEADFLRAHGRDEEAMATLEEVRRVDLAREQLENRE
jgi:hypothetical protein